MVVYIFETHDPENGEYFIDVFASEEHALRKACRCAQSFMQDYGLDDSSHSSHNDYLKVKSLISAKKFRDALRHYRDWVNTIDYNDALFYSVYCENVIEHDDTSFDDEVESSQTITLAAKQVPCKQCGKNVTESEPSCWWCGCSDPGK